MQITVDINRDDYVAFNRYVMDKKIRPKYFWWMFAITLGMVVVTNLLQRQRLSIILVQVVVFTVLFLIISQVIRWLNSILVRAMPLKNGAILGQKSYSITNEGFCFSTAAGSGITKWSAIRSVEESKTHTYVFLDTMMAYIIPHRAFASIEARGAFVQEIRARVAHTSLN